MSGLIPTIRTHGRFDPSVQYGTTEAEFATQQREYDRDATERQGTLRASGGGSDFVGRVCFQGVSRSWCWREI